jgi:hypothetical protein
MLPDPLFAQALHRRTNRNQYDTARSVFPVDLTKITSVTKPSAFQVGREPRRTRTDIGSIGLCRYDGPFTTMGTINQNKVSLRVEKDQTPIMFQFFTEIGVIEQLIRAKLERALPDRIKSHSSPCSTITDQYRTEV